MKHRRPKYRLKSRIRLVALLVVLFLVAGGGYLWAAGLLPFGPEGGPIIPPDENEMYQGRKNILLLGMDAREGETKARTDTMMLASIDTEKNQLAVVSIPRDTRVEIAGHGVEKINSTTLYGGPELAMSTVSDLLGVSVDDYVITNYEGFKEIIDTLDGVTLDVGERMYHYDPQDGGIYTINLKPGVQRLDGEKALQFVRYRGYALGDISRTEAQQKFLTALTKEVLQAGTVPKLPKLVAKLNDAVSTSMSFTEMVKLANVARKMTGASIVTQTLPGTFLDYKGTSYWSVDPSQARQMVARLLDGEKYAQVVQGSAVVPGDNNKKDETENNMLPGGVMPGGAAPDTGATGDGTATEQTGGSSSQPISPDGQSSGKTSKPKKSGSAGGSDTVIITPGNSDAPDQNNETDSGGNITITPDLPQAVPGGIFPRT